MHGAGEVAEVGRRVAVAEVQRQVAVGGLGRLLEQEEGLNQAGLAGAVGAEDACDWAQRDVARVFPRLEPLEPEVGQHRKALPDRPTRHTAPAGLSLIDVEPRQH